jgi:ATP-dependent DNA helicase RecQ
VQKDICDKLKFQKRIIFRQSFERPNLSYSVFQVDSKINKVIDIMKRIPGSGIVYCKSRKRTKEISELLQLEGISADFYHAGLRHEERSKKQESWINNTVKVIVCTNAFGMGIDKPDVRIVVHADVPDCLENYYQEAGRAGRDGKTAFAVLLYSDEAIKELKELPAQRFPSLPDIKIVYQAIANYLQLSTGTGQGIYYDFDIVDFMKKFKLNSHTVLYSIKALEQEGYWNFNEQLFVSAKVQFSTSKDYLYEFEKANPALDPLLKTLLRTYEGIFDHTISISEKMIAGLLRKDVEEIKKQLAELHRSGIIEYIAQKDSPQLLLLRNRIKTEEIYINAVVYNQRKEKLQQRITKIIQYIKEDTQCRGQNIASYFGDPDVKSCGICDNCLRQKGTTIDKEEFEAIYHRIINIVKYESLPVRELLQKLGGIKKEKAWKVIEFLQAEDKIEMNTAGWVTLK